MLSSFILYAVGMLSEYVQLIITISLFLLTFLIKRCSLIMRISLLFIILAAAVSCQTNSKNPEVQKLFDEVMVIHDEVMPEMSTLNKLKRQIRKISGNNEESLAMIKGIEDADEAMMSWMAQFKPDKSKTIEEQKAYLIKEKVNIQKVSDQMYG
ncbi:MAG: hypothetical protein HKO89_03165, partial [Saprospiraceae bacterium]|nr:hypothetical protein [Saprospiraceae bacterium]